MKKNPPNHHRNFNGTVDDLLKHASQIDADVVEHELTNDVPLEDEEHIDTIMADFNCSKEDAKVILEEMKLAQVTEMVDEMVGEGLLEITGYDEDGEPRFGQTELGKAVCEEEKKRRETEA